MRKIVKEMLERFPKGTPPYQVDIKAALEHFIGKKNIYYTDLPLAVGGFLIFIDSEPHVVINKLHGENRRRWSEAHELSEYLLHKDKLHASLYFHLRGNDSVEEHAVNKLAGEMLMPGPVLAKMVGDFRKLNMSHMKDEFIMQLYKKFGVSKEALLIRFQELHIHL
jgi:Zn-dependent peptidase ImmA (M78 family)